MVSRLPGLKTLTGGLNAVLCKNGFAEKGVTVLRRKPNLHESTFPSEIVTCKLNPEGTLLRLFCKYGTKEFYRAYGHRGGIPYESNVYSKILAPLRTSTPAFYGSYRDPKSHAVWLIIEYLHGASRGVSETNEAVIRAAHWIGRFHDANEKCLENSSLGFIHRYDEDYYVGWARRASRLFRDHKTELPWLARLCSGFEEFVPELLEAPRTVIHGEFYASNIIYQNGISRPADWQSAAVAPGEIDLAALTQNRPEEAAARLRREYASVRWPGGEPELFDRVYKIAKVYMTLRWLGDPSLVSPQLKSLVFSKISLHDLPLRRRNLARKYRKFVQELRLQGQALGLS